MKTLSIALLSLILGASLNEFASQTRWDGYREALEVRGHRLYEEQEVFIRKAVEFERLQDSICRDYFAKTQVKRVAAETQNPGWCQ